MNLNLNSLNRPKRVYLACFYASCMALCNNFVFLWTATLDNKNLTWIWKTSNLIILFLCILHFIAYLIISKNCRRILTINLMGIISIIYLALMLLTVSSIFFMISKLADYYITSVTIAFFLVSWYSIKQTSRRLRERKFISKEYFDHGDHFTIKEPSVEKYHKPLPDEKNIFIKIFNLTAIPIIFLFPFIEPANRVLIRNGQNAIASMSMSIIGTPLLLLLFSGLAKHFYTTVWIPFSIERKTGKKVYFEEI